MSRVLIIVILLGFCSFTMAEWESIGPYGGRLLSLVVSPSHENIIYSASSGLARIHKSTDAGDSWTKVGMIADYVNCINIDPFNPDILYIGGYTGVYKSTDGGANWDSCSIPEANISALVIHPHSPDTIFAAGQSLPEESLVLFRSTDYGENWSEVTLDPGSGLGNANCIIIDPTDQNVVYLGGYYRTSDTTINPVFYKSTNGGTIFTEMSSGLPSGISVTSLGIHPSNSDTVYAGTSHGIYRSINGGGFWSKVAPFCGLRPMVTTPADPDVVYAGGLTSVCTSTDAGYSWFKTDTGLRGSRFYSLGISLTQSSHVYTGGSEGFFKTIDGGNNWYESNNGMNLRSINALGSAPSSPAATIYTEFEDIGVYKTTDNGLIWISQPTPSECGVSAFAVHNTNPNIVLVLGSGV
jgi:photosystem II stability/assembly factor-like uncharacterized protein